MGRGQSACGRCGGKDRRNSVRNIVITCPGCQKPICNTHVTWSSKSNTWVCGPCERNGV